MAIVDPHSWSVLPFGDETAWVDFAGQHDLQHRQFASAILALGKPSYPLLPLGDAGAETWEGLPFLERLRKLADWHLAHQLVHAGETSSLGIAASPDFTAYDLSDPNDFATYAFLHALQHVTIRGKAGI